MYKEMYEEYQKYLNEHTQEEIRKETIMWLENKRNSGGFENKPENNMNFNELTDDEIDKYFKELVFPDNYNRTLLFLFNSYMR
ncbi:hypothetical protein [Peptoniphilus timonensis]|uniref:hypothetical protein n=1 Tax=Peptoniphilus timonensis TaxID=1268254 RepID=UPI0002FEAFA0|nr:hypothetical protein [Peptoniphilus timonensis]